MNENQAERIAVAFEKMADVLQKWYAADHPEKKAPSEPTITYVKDETEQMLEDQGQTGEETIEDWTTLGPREREFLGKK